jgi:hypothetical protein
MIERLIELVADQAATDKIKPTAHAQSLGRSGWKRGIGKYIGGAFLRTIKGPPLRRPIQAGLERIDLVMNSGVIELGWVIRGRLPRREIGGEVGTRAANRVRLRGPRECNVTEKGAAPLSRWR